MKIHAIRLTPGDDLKLSLENFVREKNIGAGAILTCVGSLKHVVLRMANESNPVVEEKKFEIVSLVGTLSTAGSHLHISLSDNKGYVTGGHLLTGNLVFTTAEIIIGEFPDLSFLREMDNETGFKELLINHR